MINYHPCLQLPGPPQGDVCPPRGQLQHRQRPAQRRRPPLHRGPHRRRGRHLRGCGRRQDWGESQTGEEDCPQDHGENGQDPVTDPGPDNRMGLLLKFKTFLFSCCKGSTILNTRLCLKQEIRKKFFHSRENWTRFQGSALESCPVLP